MSTSSWPHDGFWPDLIRKFNITYQSIVPSMVDYNAHLISDPTCFNDTKHLEIAKALDDHRRKNFLKV